MLQASTLTGWWCSGGRRDGQELHEQVDPGEVLPNHDGTFQVSVDLNLKAVPQEDWGTGDECSDTSSENTEGQNPAPEAQPLTTGLRKGVLQHPQHPYFPRYLEWVESESALKERG
ncbi:unnamed protein product [Boreogadus saida]